ncbi:MAG: hypothetical protein AB3X44_19545 [Leptothrix sp. (in: b-proteobacteria)]
MALIAELMAAAQITGHAAWSLRVLAAGCWLAQPTSVEDLAERSGLIQASSGVLPAQLSALPK